MSDLTWHDAVVGFLDAQPHRGLVHYTDLAAALAERDPERFWPSEDRATPHFSLWRAMNESESFEKLGRGWFRFKEWGPAGDVRLRLSRDQEAFKHAVSAVRAPRRGTSSPLLQLLDDEARRAEEVALRSASIAEARALVLGGPLDEEGVRGLLRAWSRCGGRTPGTVLYNRFAPAFIGAYLNRYRDQIAGRW